MKRPIILTVAALALSTAITTPALAQGYSTSSDAGLLAGQLDVPLNKSQVVTVDRPFARAMVGNEAIADIVPVTNRSLYVLGKQMGTTSLTIYDKNNIVISVVDVAVGPDIVSLRRQMAELIPGEQIGARISNDAVVLTGVVSNGPAVDRAMELAKTYAGDKVINMMSVGASQQVMLEVRFSEINRQTGKQIGFSAFTGSDGGTFGSAIGNGAGLVPDPDTGEGILRLDSITGSFGVFRKAFSAFGLNINATLDALERKGLVKTLAEPTLVALSGETASFLAGGEFPIPVQQGNNGGGGGGGGGNGGITIEFKPFGVSLAFTPTVLADGIINLQVEPEVSSIDPSASITVNGLVIPGLQTRRANTVLELRDGESFALAGLIRKDFATTVRQVPLLGSIPIIGSLFRSSGFTKGETELVIVVTPRIVQPVKANQIKLPTDRVQNPHELDLFLMGRTDKAVGINPLDPDAPPPEAKSSTTDKKGGDYDY